MSFLQNDDEESEKGKPKSNPTRMIDMDSVSRKDNSLELQRWHSFKDEMIKGRKDKGHSFSGQIQKNSLELSEPKMHSLILTDKSNSELRNSVASKYVDYLDHVKKVVGDIAKKNDHGEEFSKELSKLRQGREANILLNSTILSSCFADRSFHEPINEISDEAEADFIEEGSRESAGRNSSFFDENPRDGISKIYNRMDKDSFSFDNNRGLSGLLEDFDEEKPQPELLPVLKELNEQTSFDTMENVTTLELAHFMRKASYIEPVLSYSPEEPYIKVTVSMLTVHGAKPKEEYILTGKGLVNSRKNSSAKSLVIGRWTAEEDEINPNDIVFSSADKFVSRVHCCVVYKHLLSPHKISRPFMTFLSGKYPKIGGPSCPVGRLNFQSLVRIYSFLKPKKTLYALDLASTTGTFKRAR